MTVRVGSGSNAEQSRAAAAAAAIAAIAVALGWIKLSSGLWRDGENRRNWGGKLLIYVVAGNYAQAGKVLATVRSQAVEKDSLRP